MKIKGFTLIELLAVIVVLAIIALISVPIITNVIDKAKEGAAASSALGYIDGVEKQTALNMINTELEDIIDGTYTVEQLKKYGVSIKGKAPSVGDIEIENKKVKTADLCINNYKVNYSDNKAKVISKGCEDVEIVCEIETNTSYTFNYTGNEQEFNVPCNGNYKLEVWGAEGGTAYADYGDGGYGSYSTGLFSSFKEDVLYINVGGKGLSNNNSATAVVIGGYNGGGDGGSWTGTGGSNGNIYTGSGGGSTHIATKKGILKNLSNEKSSVIIVAGGGGGGYFHNNFTTNSYGDGGSAGGYVGNSGIKNGTSSIYLFGTGGTQTTFGTNEATSSNYSNAGFGYGAIGYVVSSFPYSGGGSGYYGGGPGYFAGSGGGSGYIGNSLLTDKVMYCYNCSQSNDESTKTVTTANVSETPTSNFAKKGNGYAKITYLGK